MLDPIQIGYTHFKNLDATIKACKKRDSSENLGLIGKKDGRYNVMAYSEVPQDVAKSNNSGLGCISV